MTKLHQNFENPIRHDSLRINDAILNEMESMLRKLGRPFCKELIKCKEGIFTKALYREDIPQLLIDDEVRYMNEILPKGTYACRVQATLYIHIREFKSYVIKHYEERLKEARSTDEAMFLRATLHGLKTANA